MVVRRRIDVKSSHRLSAKVTTLSELESAMIDLSRLLDLSIDSIVETLDRA